MYSLQFSYCYFIYLEEIFFLFYIDYDIINQTI